MDIGPLLLEIVLLVIGALLAVGGLLLIKITRRRQLARGHPMRSSSVPSDAMSKAEADRWVRRYLWSAVAVLMVLIVGVLIVLPR